jgi:hypothetical protein
MIRFRKRLRRSKPPSRNFASISFEATDPIHEKKAAEAAFGIGGS